MGNRYTRYHEPPDLKYHLFYVIFFFDIGSAPYPGVPAENLYDLLTKDGYRMRKPRTCSRKL